MARYGLQAGSGLRSSMRQLSPLTMGMRTSWLRFWRLQLT